MSKKRELSRLGAKNKSHPIQPADVVAAGNSAVEKHSDRHVPARDLFGEYPGVWLGSDLDVVCIEEDKRHL